MNRCPMCNSANINEDGYDTEERVDPYDGDYYDVEIILYRCIDCGHEWDEEYEP